MKVPDFAVLGLCASLAVAGAIADPVQPPPQPPSTLPPSTLPPGSPAPAPASGVDLGRRSPDPSSVATETAKVDASTREADKIKNLARTSEGFAAAAAQDGMLEVELGKLAAGKGSNQSIRDFGKHMASDHEKANAELKRVAKAANVNVPNELDAEHKAKLAELKSKSGVAFDAAYAAAMDKDHEKALGLFREAGISPGVDSSLQAFAKKTLPTLEEHSSIAKQLHAGTAAMANQPRLSTDN